MNEVTYQYKMIPIVPDRNMFRGEDRTHVISEYEKNSHLKCFRKGCNNLRKGNHLFCSSECKNLYYENKKV